MYYGAISTDIRKSSTNWNLFPEWMQKAVNYTNNITEFVFNDTNLFNGIILPNSPEGDAYTFYYQHENEDELINGMRTVATVLQLALLEARNQNHIAMTPDEIKAKLEDEIRAEYDKNNKNMNKKIQDYLEIIDKLDKQEYNYIGNIFIRIGIAISSKKPDEYHYKGKTSYRGGVIDMSEEAERQAPWHINAKGLSYAFGEYENGKVKKKLLQDDGSIAKYIKSKWFVFENVMKRREYTVDKSQSGLVVFVGYTYGITDEMMTNYPHMFNLRRNEFKKLHDETNDVIGNNYLIKVKRDSSSMYYIPNESPRFTHAKYVSFFNKCSTLLSMLPTGSSIGICYSGSKDGNLNVIRKDGRIIDIFGPSVNMAARMESVDFKYPTSVGETVSFDHHNRISFGCWEERQIEKMIGSSNNKKGSDATIVTEPYRIDKVPLELLNAGYGNFIHILSKRLHGSTGFKIGDRIRYKGSRGTYLYGKIHYIDPINATIELDDNNKLTHEIRVRMIEKVPRDNIPDELKEIIANKPSVGIKVGVKL